MVDAVCCVSLFFFFSFFRLNCPLNVQFKSFFEKKKLFILFSFSLQGICLDYIISISISISI